MDEKSYHEAFIEYKEFINLNNAIHEPILISNKFVNQLLVIAIKKELNNSYNDEYLYDMLTELINGNNSYSIKAILKLLEFNIGRLSMIEQKSVLSASIKELDYKPLLQLAIVEGRNCFDEYNNLRHTDIKRSKYKSVDDYLIKETLFEIKKMLDIIKVKDTECEASDALRIFSYADDEISTIIKNDYYEYINSKMSKKR